MTEQITVRGYVATDPESRSLPDGTVVVTFRLASTPRRYDVQNSSWRDGHTNWFTVHAFRALGLNVLASLKKGQPVVVVGRLKVRFWEGEHGRNTAVDVDAVSVGHDFALGTAGFRRTLSSASPADPSAPSSGAPEGVPGNYPADETATYPEPARQSPDEVDREIGEILDTAAEAGAGADPATAATAPGARLPRRQPATV